MTTARTCLLIVGWGKKGDSAQCVAQPVPWPIAAGISLPQVVDRSRGSILVGFSDQDKAETPCRKAEPHLPAWPRDPSQEVAMPYLGAELMV